MSVKRLINGIDFLMGYDSFIADDEHQIRHIQLRMDYLNGLFGKGYVSMTQRPYCLDHFLSPLKKINNDNKSENI